MPSKLRVKNKAQKVSMRAGIKDGGGQIEGGGGKVLLLLGKVNQSILFWGK